MKSFSVKILLILACIISPVLLNAQEFLCSVTVNSTRVTSDKQVFQEMQRAISEYINNFQWTQDKYEHYEKIRWNLRIIVNDRPSADYFRARANIQAYRPVYNSTEETMVFNLNDNNFSFNYVAMQQMPHLDNTFSNNLTALLDYYANLVLGFDYDSFSEDGGSPYFRKCQEIINLASNSNEKGWRAEEDNRNRHWILENLTNSRYKRFHSVLYQYHREGMDMMSEDLSKGREAIIASLRDMNEIKRQNPLILLVRMFLDAKENELVQVFSKALPNQKQEFLSIMQELDPANTAKYNAVQGEGR